MTAPLADLESQRDALLRCLLLLGDFRPGSISATSGRCGKPACHCHQPSQPGHGPHWRLTYKRQGKTVSESLPDEPARRKAEREVAAYREFQQLSRQLLDLNLTICRLRPPALTVGTGLVKKNGPHAIPPPGRTRSCGRPDRRCSPSGTGRLTSGPAQHHKSDPRDCESGRRR